MRALLFVLYASFVTLFPVLVVLFTHGAFTPFWFLSGDAYLYLGIAETSTPDLISFDGLAPTNGFHPLWQLLVGLFVWLSPTQIVALNIVSWVSILTTLAGVLCLGFAIKRFTGSWLLAMLVVPGVYYMLAGQTLRNMPIWSFFDGMEVGLACLLSAILILLASYSDAQSNRPRYWFLVGILLALQVMTRLDEVFVSIAVTLAVLFWPRLPTRDRITFGALVAAPSALALAGFVAWSYATTGLPTPVSGIAKGSGAFLSNSWVTLATLFAPIIELREAVSGGYEADRAALLGAAFRVTELIVPGLFSLGLLVYLARKYPRHSWAPLVIGLCAGVVVKTAYTFVAVNYWHQATWYFALSTTLMTFGVALMLKPMSERMRKTIPFVRVCAAALLAISTLFHASLWASESMVDPYPHDQMIFWQDRESLEARLLAIDPNMRVLEFGDGLINYSLNLPVRHGFVFAGDAGSLEALQASRLLRHSYDDGFTTLASYFYLIVPEGAEDWTSADIRAFLEASFLDARVKTELDWFDFEMLHVARPQGAPFIRLIPREVPFSAMQTDA